jgi:uncharacterized protein YbjT (DUF2867 family)
MTVVAVAGGSGKLGRAIVDGIVAAGKFEVVILARQADDAKSKEVGARIIAVDYTDPKAIASVLDTNKIEVVISALSSQSPPEAELNLIKAASEASVTKRYIPSLWGVHYDEAAASFFPPAAAKLSYVEALKKTSLEWTYVSNGYFLDYYGAPKVKTYMPPLSCVVDVANDFAGIPGSGDVPITFTHTFDVGKFTAALLTKTKWEDEESIIIGDKVTFNEFVRLAEEIKKTKFTVKYDSIEKLKTGQITELPSHPANYPYFPKEMLQGIFSAIGILLDQGYFNLKTDHTLNSEFPDIKPMTVREIITEAYAA